MWIQLAPTSLLRKRESSIGLEKVHEGETAKEDGRREKENFDGLQLLELLKPRQSVYTEFTGCLLSVF